MIRVFDELGNEVNPTYPKRARGLVKQGRARWADDADDVIVLTPNTEENSAYPSDINHTLEDTEMFENTNVNEEIIETAEVTEAVEAVEETEAVEEEIGETAETTETVETIEETETVEESGLPLNEELNRLYGILENIDQMLMNISAMGPSIPEDMNGMDYESVQAVADAVMSESNRLRFLAEQYTAMRAQTLSLINKVKDEAKPERKSDGFDEERFIAYQINMAMETYMTMSQSLNDSLRCKEIGMDDYRAQMAAVQEDCDERVKKLRRELNAVKYGG